MFIFTLVFNSGTKESQEVRCACDWKESKTNCSKKRIKIAFQIHIPVALRLASSRSYSVHLAGSSSPKRLASTVDELEGDVNAHKWLSDAAGSGDDATFDMAAPMETNSASNNQEKEEVSSWRSRVSPRLCLNFER